MYTRIIEKHQFEVIIMVKVCNFFGELVCLKNYKTLFFNG